jgi:hypothetical protein
MVADQRYYRNSIIYQEAMARALIQDVIFPRNSRQAPA